MSKLKIYANHVSGNCWKVKWTADYLAIPNEWIEIDIFAGASRTPEFLAINPWGQTPTVLLPDGRVLTQSNAIISYLAEGSTLVPTDGYARAQMNEWLFWEQNSHETTIATRRAHLNYRGKIESEIDPGMLEGGKRALARMEQHLVKKDYLVGDGLTLADIALVAYTRVAPEGGFDLTPYPSVQNWIRRIEHELDVKPIEAA
ncbi:glutathione S-transferase family protein [Hyphococcus sp.]|uniref:glutathione S-transferase family protein n=1 Tax=Hyphococcus sp. TaxID=2038636 RepID=UPI00208405A9|nr:MAG: glutathione S-transferase [Marinicaulis sp.]